MEKRPMVLIVDDDKVMRELLKDLLERDGIDTMTAGDGHEALLLLSHKTPDLVLTDLVMPGMDGFGLIGTLKRQNLFKSVPIIAITSVAGKGFEAKALALGASGFLQKSDISRNFGEHVREVLANA